MPLLPNLRRKKLNKWLRKTGLTAPVTTPEEVEAAKLLSDLTLFSTAIFVILALLFRFSLNLITAVLLQYYHISFRYRLFDLHFSSVDGSKWPATRILFVFGFGYMLFTLIGISLVLIYKRIHNVNWKTRLILTWMAFLLANSIPAGIIAGVLFFTNFGIVFTWIVSSFYIRILIAAAVLMMMILLRPFWVYMFLKASPSRVFLIDNESIKQYIQHVFFKSWLLGFILLLFFNWPMLGGYWPAFLFSLGFISMHLFKLPMLQEVIYIRKSEKKIFTSYRILYYLAGLLLFIRITGTFFSLSF